MFATEMIDNPKKDKKVLLSFAQSSFHSPPTRHLHKRPKVTWYRVKAAGRHNHDIFVLSFFMVMINEVLDPVMFAGDIDIMRALSQTGLDQRGAMFSIGT
jgi:hypothetical protein